MTIANKSHTFQIGGGSTNTGNTFMEEQNLLVEFIGTISSDDSTYSAKDRGDPHVESRVAPLLVGICHPSNGLD